MTNTTALLESVKTIAVKAGDRIMAIYKTDFDVQTKDDASPLTAADMASHKTIIAGLKELTPEIPVLSEESAAIAFAERSQWSRFWLVDPLDGTKEFVKRNDEFTVNIALIDGHEPVVGVVYIPATGVCYYAVKDQGAFRQRNNDTARPISVKSLTDQPIQVVGSRSHGGDSLARFVSRLGAHELVVAGSSLKFCLIAEGKADIYPRLGPTSEWDTAAAQCVVEQAGGCVITTDGKRLLYNCKESLLNPYFLVIADQTRDWLTYLSEKP